MHMRITTTQTQKQILAPALQQSINVLMLPLLELNSSIEQELQINPLLELEAPEKSPQFISVSQYPESHHFSQIAHNQTYIPLNEDEPQEIPVEQKKTLEEHLLTQLRIEFSDPLRLSIGELIIGNLNQNGYLTTSVDEIALLARTGDQHLVENVLKIIQNFDPVGIASRDITECLTIQAMSHQDETCRNLALAIIKNHFTDLCHKRFDLIARKMQTPANEIKTAAHFIATLEPNPARNFRVTDQTIYAKADIFVYKTPEGKFSVEINTKESPRIRINPLYQKLLNDPNLSSVDRQFIQDKLTSAVQFIKSVQQRGETLLGIARFIVDNQKDFFEGTMLSLNPMSLKDIAQTLQRNESTISRAIYGKYMQTPQGLFSLKYFFSQSINEQHKNISSHNIKEEIKELIANENKKAPLSDEDIIKHFQQKGLKVARRTINKYRQELRIPASYLRKE